MPIPWRWRSQQQRFFLMLDLGISSPHSPSLSQLHHLAFPSLFSFTFTFFLSRHSFRRPWISSTAMSSIFAFQLFNPIATHAVASSRCTTQEWMMDALKYFCV
ncbi:hypothetical protein M758_9G157900 [Ceratodon purpureus]|nr:hypothetical protein M758_9G157900 [Ceratodon purpureus]